jgi:glutamine phosphoribosylpyrophosphate amidotransferase
MHVRDHTKGRPSLAANNHPIRHGSIVGVHNGRIENDDEVFARLQRNRAEAGMTVDSEAIFASLDHDPDNATALERLRGSIATGWFDERSPGTVTLARGYGRPLWIAEVWGGKGHTILWASTLEAIEIAREFLGISVFVRPVRPGTILGITSGKITESSRFTPDKSAEWLLNPVASPAERDLCLRRLGVAM